MSIQNCLSELDKLFDSGKCNEDLVSERSKLSKELRDINSSASLDMFQKAKIRWAIEGDENSKYFYGIVNKKRSHLAIRRVLVEGDWIVDPSNVKKEFLNHFSNRFDKPISPILLLKSQFPNVLTSDQLVDLKRDVTHEEIKKAVWDCGINKSPGPNGIFPPGCNSPFITLIPKTQEAKVVKDFRPISLIGSVYKVIAKILANSFTLVISSLISEVQSAFVSNLQILDGPFILNELLSWCKHKISKAMIFKVDFEKAFDSVRWDYLDDVLNKFGFRVKWRTWIQGCLNFAMGSILVNEAQLQNLNSTKGLPIDSSLTLSHLFYADDAVFIVGGLMSRRSSWEEVIGKLSSRLSKWKLKNLSIGGCLTLNKSILSSLTLYHMSIFNCPMGVLKLLELIRQNFFNGVSNSDRRLALIGWDKIMASKKNANVLLLQINDHWVWNLESSGDFSVKSARSFIDDLLLPKADVPTRWVKVVPIKINIFGWRVCLDKLPTRLNLSLRGIDIPSILCPLCSIAVESSSHLLFSCQLARSLMLKVARWWKLDIHDFNSYGDWIVWLNNIRFSSKLKEILEGRTIKPYVLPDVTNLRKRLL
ncbi:RNA-directed DNA polymerase, eukaryota, reverse transcriptase zinc-binding domain protein [Tanacetum coccineum]|uniref:RNA-directed DNA polymerase, eukaryota, reverse transcriptase zinc-binding domain protein n=1 Tax=Tanacetum coccineum TaxID=301880 RepID=A0ABQ5IBR2_9ASTR